MSDPDISPSIIPTPGGPGITPAPVPVPDTGEPSAPDEPIAPHPAEPGPPNPVEPNPVTPTPEPATEPRQADDDPGHVFDQTNGLLDELVGDDDTASTGNGRDDDDANDVDPDIVAGPAREQ